MGNLVFQATLGGQVNLVGPNTASTYNISVPTVTGTMVTTGDTGTVTNTMLAGSIANAKLSNSSITLGSTSISLGATVTALTGLTTVSMTGLTASADSSFTSTGYLQISKGTTAQQPGSPSTGMLRYNTTTNQFEGYSGASPAWNPVGGATLSNDTSTSTNVYPLFANATSGSASTIYTSNAKLLYKPSTGEFSANAPVASNGIFVNNATVSASYTIGSGYNGQSVGPMTIASGQSVSVSSGQRWLIL